VGGRSLRCRQIEVTLGAKPPHPRLEPQRCARAGLSDPARQADTCAHLTWAWGGASLSASKSSPRPRRGMKSGVTAGRAADEAKLLATPPLLRAVACAHSNSSRSSLWPKLSQSSDTAWLTSCAFRKEKGAVHFKSDGWQAGSYHASFTTKNLLATAAPRAGDLVGQVRIPWHAEAAR
jgi:hypothetical protein